MATHSTVNANTPMYGLTGWVVGLIPATLFFYFISLLGKISHGETVLINLPWIPSLHVNLAFNIDGLGLLFALIITGVGTFIMIYGGGYLADDPYLGRFYIYIISFMVAMLGVVLADNILLLFVFWELTSITSYMLIGYKHGYKDSREAAKMAFLVTGGGGLALLAGVIMLGLAAETWYLSEMLASQTNISNHLLYPGILVTILLGAFTKSAQFPFHFWLPGAMAAPTPVSAYLHSATMVKAGVYLLARLNPIMNGADVWHITLILFGGLTMLMGAYIAWQHQDLKRILAYSTVSALGTLVMLIGIGTEYAITAAMTFLLVHSLYKGCLFMVAGSIDHETGTRDITHLGGLRTVMPVTFTAALVAILSMSGIPPLLGFVGKELIYEATLQAPTWSLILTGIAVLTNALTILAGGLILIIPFWGNLGTTPKQPHEAPPTMYLGPVMLSSLGLLLGLLVPITKTFPGILPFKLDAVSEFIISPPVSAILNDTIHVHLSQWHGFNTAFILSLITVTLGIVGYLGHVQMKQAVQGLTRIPEIVGPERLYHLGLDGLMWVAETQTRLLQNGYLRYYLVTIMATTSLLLGLAMTRWVSLDALLQMPTAYAYEWLLVLVFLGATYLAVRSNSRLTAVLALGVIGFGVGLIFALYSAPDLAMTQFSIETLVTILLVLVLYRLPPYLSFTSPVDRNISAIVAIISGIMMTILVLAVTKLKTPSLLAPYFAENSYSLAQGRNVVNVILVDFRGTDTFGEIIVLSVAAIGVFALLNLRLNDKEEKR